MRSWTGRSSGPIREGNSIRRAAPVGLFALRRQGSAASARGVPGGVGVGELSASVFDVVRALLDGSGSPLAPRLVDEVAAVDVDRPGEPVAGVRDTVDRVVAEQHGV